MKYAVEVNNNVEIFEINKVAKQAAGACLMKVKNTVVLATVARENTQVEEDFLPLTVQYIEKQYAAGRIPGGYIKRETKPGDFETLTSRIIDRSLRPLFPKGYAYPTQIVVFVLSADPEIDLQVVGLNAASVALYLSDIPMKAPVCGVRVGYINDSFVINPTNSELQNSALDLYVAGVKDEMLMIEMRSLPSMNGENQNMNEFSEDKMVEAIDFASKAILAGSTAYENTFSALKKPDAALEYKPEVEDENIANFIEQNFTSDVQAAINQMAKSERATELDKIVNKIMQSETAIQNEWQKNVVSNIIGKFKRKIIRSQIINERRRADGRALDEIRPISIETNILPNAHGSCLFTRGQTQALVVTTLGGETDAQVSDSLTSNTPISERFMFQYNFPGFCVGEASPLKSPGRRELGHGNLAKRALTPSVPLNNPQVIRTVSEILESNGSSSMASVCGGSLSLRAAGVSTLKLVAGVAMGLIFEDDKHAILTDIMGLEDHDGDMDFKVAGTREGITALQMDIKLGGISLEILREALNQAKDGRNYILNLMEVANDDIIINEEILPKIEIFGVDPNKMVDIIGQGGKTIKELIDKYEVSIDLERDSGEVKIQGANKINVENAKSDILNIVKKSNDFKKGSKFGHHHERKETSNFQVGEEFDGVVKKIMDFGAFISLKDGIDGLLHVSKIKTQLSEGDTLRVKVEEIKRGKISLELCE